MLNKSILYLVFGIMILIGSLGAIEYQKNPYRAMLYSALLPGGGQLYTEAYVKSAVVIGLQAFLIGTAIHHNNKIEHYQELMDNYGNKDINYLFYKSKRDDYRDNLRSDYWWIGTVLVLSLADAFVDAHLYNYNAEKRKVQLKFEDKMLQMEFHF